MAPATPAPGSVTATLTDGTGISPITREKFVKDFVVDFVITAVAGIAGGAGLDALDVGSIIAAPDIAVIALAGALIKAGVRAVLRWGTS
jgi:hypothetical protein